MIDYLEALLEEEAEESGDSLLPGRRVLVRRAVPTEEGAALPAGSAEGREEEVPPIFGGSKTGGEDTLTAAPALAGHGDWQEETSLPARSPEEWGAEERETVALAEEIRREKLANRAALAVLTGSAGETGALVLYQALRKAAQVARTGRMGPGTVALTLPDRAPSSPGLTLNDIDRAVQRDARRFDGGYSLY